MQAPPSRTARVLDLDLATLDAGPAVVGPVRWPDELGERLARWGGSGLAAALFLREPLLEEGQLAPLVLAVGDAVRRGVPTAARLSVASRGALSRRYAEGQVGGDLALRLVRFADALVVRGRTARPGAVLVLDGEGRAHLQELPELAGARASEVRRRLHERFGECGALYVGPAGAAGVPFATLMSGLEHASHVGRGGLGAVLAGAGLAAIVLAGPPIRLPRQDAGEDEGLVRELVRSPRLRSRADGGTHELWGAFAARGELRGRNYAEELDAEDARSLWREASEASGERHGCPGCPTPCGWSFDFERAPGAKSPRFGAAWALGPNVGLASLEAATELFAECDELGVDAKEAGAVVALLLRARELGRLEEGPTWGAAPSELVPLLRRWVERPRDAGSGALGAEALAHELGLEHEVHVVHGQTVRPDRDLASLLGQCVSSNGADPMRTFPFATADGLTRERLAGFARGLPLCEGIERADDPRGVGRLVWWHENLIAALDATGFCSFSAGSLLADGACDPERLGQWLAPEEERGADLVELGAALVHARRELARRWGAAGEVELPRWVRERLGPTGVLEEYLAARGLDERGEPRPATRDRALAGELVRSGFEALAARDAVAVPTDTRPSAPVTAVARGAVTLRAVGGLGDRLGGDARIELALPASAAEVVQELARTRPEVAAELVREGRVLPAIWRAGRRLEPSDGVEAGDVLDLVLAVSGG